MNALRRFKRTSLFLCSGVLSLASAAQCTNQTFAPQFLILPAGGGQITTISTCTLFGDYSQITGVVAGTAYQFTVTGGGYITVHQDTYDGAVIGQGYSPVLVIAATSGDIFPHWNVNENCQTSDLICETSTVQWYDNCIPPTATYEVVNDCVNLTYTVVVDLLTTGDGSTVNIQNSLDGIPWGELPGSTPGQYILGPFSFGQITDLTIAHESNFECNQVYTGITNSLCPIVSCGPDNYTHCYQNSEDFMQVFQGASTFPIILQFQAGSLYQFDGGGDLLTIHDGLTANDPVLFAATSNNFDLTGVSVTSTNPDHALTLHMTSNTFGSCGDGSASLWEYTVGCLDCVPATATYTINTDCNSQTWSVDVNITALGSDPDLEITNTGGAPTVVATAPGVYNVGPLTVGQAANVTLVNDANPLCNVNFGTLIHSQCPIIGCGPYTVDYCYPNSVDTTILYQGNSTFPLAMLFNAGQIESCCDNFTIYDGQDATAPILFQGNNGGDMTGIFVVSTNPDHYLYVVFHSDGSVNCQDNGWTPLNWTVSCLDCNAPQATFTANTDCANQTWSIDVNITDLGTDPSLDITNTGGAPALVATAPGLYTVGPLQLDVPAVVTLVNDMNPLCSVHSPELVNSFCVIQSCGPNNYTHCYANNEIYTQTFQGTSTFPIAILFNAGQIITWDGDLITIYDGLDDTYPVLYSGTGNFGDLTGLFFASTNPDHALTLRVTSTPFTSCEDGGINVPWDYTVSCLDCVAPLTTFDIQLDCANDQFYVAVDVNAMGTDPAIDVTNTGGAPALVVSDTGTYLVGPFNDGTQLQVSLINDLNPLCNVVSPLMINPPCPVISCGPNTYTYCYNDFWDSTIVYQSSSTYPIALQFNSGTLEGCCDNVTILDGANDLAPQLYLGNNGGADMGGLVWVSSTPAQSLYVKFHSDGSVNCQGGSETTLNWTVSCLDCTNPVGTFQLVPDCQHNGYNVAVNVTSTGTSPTVDLVNTYTGDTLFNVGVGTTLVGPTPVDQTTTINVLNSQNPLCHIASQQFFWPADSCITTACDPQAWDYCYGNSDTAWFIFTSGTAEQITLHFDYGQLLVNDYIQVYNGLDTTAQLIYMGNQGGNLGGFEINSSNPDHALTLLVISSAAGSCASGQAGYMWFSVGCGMVGVDEMADQPLSLYPNPSGGDVYLSLPSNLSGRVRVDLIDMTGRQVYQTGLRTSGASTNKLDLSGLATGTYQVVITTDDQVKTSTLQIAR